MTADFLTLENVSKVYSGAAGKPVRALADVSFRSRQGEWIAIMGAGRAPGKTTLLNILGCLDQASGRRGEDRKDRHLRS